MLKISTFESLINENIYKQMIELWEKMRRFDILKNLVFDFGRRGRPKKSMAH